MIKVSIEYNYDNELFSNYLLKEKKLNYQTKNAFFRRIFTTKHQYSAIL